VLAAAALAGGCGATGPSSPPSGKRLFAGSCGGCHTLTGVNAPSHQGGDLLHVRLSRPQLVQFTQEMPVRHPLTEAQVDAVTAYVLAAERRG
jgi:mono/diheme cytochrome c family protein